MEAKAKAGEEDLSMEEILQSIRKIIAEDGDEAPAGNGANPPVMTSDVLELSDMIEETPAPAAPVLEAVSKPAAMPAPDMGNDILSKIDQVVVPDAPQAAAPVAAPAPVQAAPVAAAPAMMQNSQAYIDSLLSQETATAAAAAFKKAMPMDTPIRTTPSMQMRNGSTVEDLVMEALRPMLKVWLDANLPTIVEKLVEREVRKLAH